MEECTLKVKTLSGLGVFEMWLYRPTPFKNILHEENGQRQKKESRVLWPHIQKQQIQSTSTHHGRQNCVGRKGCLGRGTSETGSITERWLNYSEWSRIEEKTL